MAGSGGGPEKGSRSSAKALSYSIAYPWGAKDEDTKDKPIVGGWWKAITDSSLPIMADMAPYIDPKGKKEELNFKSTATATTSSTASSTTGSSASKELVIGADEPMTPHTLVNSSNHGFEGQVVGYSDAHATFERRPDIGQNNENIWTLKFKDDEVAVPGGAIPAAITNNTTPFDVVMVPVRTAKGDIK